MAHQEGEPADEYHTNSGRSRRGGSEVGVKSIVPRLGAKEKPGAVVASGGCGMKVFRDVRLLDH